MHRLGSLLLLVAGVVVVGCGGGGGDAPTKAEFGASADKVCAAAEKSLTDIGKGANSRQEIADAVDKVINKTRDSLDKLKSLDRPDGSAGHAADRFISALQSDIEDKGIPALQKLRDAARSNDQKAAAQAVAQLQAINSGPTDKLAVAAGAKGCAN